MSARTPAAQLAGAADSLRARYLEEREAMLADFDRLGAQGDQAAAHAACKELLDAEHALLGDCYSEPLTELLGYEDA